MNEKMIILHIAYLTSDQYAGVNIAVCGHVRAQQKTETVALLNIGGVCNISGIQNAFHVCEYECITKLPEPFCRPNIVIFHEVYRPRFLLIAHELKQLGIPYIVFPHGSLTDTAQNIKPLKKKLGNLILFNTFIKESSAIQCLSPREAANTLFSSPKFIGTNGINVHKVAARKHNADAIRFVYIGRLDLRIKGLDLLVEAIYLQKNFLKKNNCHFDLYGPDVDGTVQTLATRINSLEISHLLEIHAPIAGADKERVLLNADYFIQSSRSEGMSMGILEALSYGVPCILTDGTGMAAWIDKEKAGYGCKTAAQAIAEAIGTAVDEISNRDNMAANAACAVAESFSWELVTRSVLSTYRTIIKCSEK